MKKSLAKFKNWLTKLKLWQKITLALASIVLILSLGFTIWASNPPSAGNLATQALKSTESIEFKDSGDLSFIPKNNKSETGLIIYPGARVFPESYADIAAKIAEAGNTVVIVKMPLNMAIFDVDAADSVIDEHPNIKNWFLAGHSLGGTSAAMYVDDHEGSVAGLIFWASYPSSNTKLNDYKGAVGSISGSEDGLSTPQKIDETKYLLPSQTVYDVIEGGNHAQFGDYGPQKGDGIATISLEDQHQQIVNDTLSLMSSSN